MAVSVKRVSRLRFGTLRLLDGFTFFDRPKLPVIDPADDDITHIVEGSDRIDLLSTKFYGTPDLWWVIARANSMILLPRDLKEGRRILIPSKQRVAAEILPAEG